MEELHTALRIARSCNLLPTKMTVSFFKYKNALRKLFLDNDDNFSVENVHEITGVSFNLPIDCEIKGNEISSQIN